ncbi:LOW QUALITY PROTEIN: hypothetical protein MC885_021644 [Smutsia gigantea]|nr:LOW QUALITY PROTEIN: hypothetical protein MC885_021644 [Smutsia gigantea]
MQSHPQRAGTKTVCLSDLALELSPGEDDISRLVEQEFLSLTREYLVLVTESSGDLEAPGGSPEGPRQPAPSLLTPPLVAGSSGYSQDSLITRDKFLEPKVAVSDTGSKQDCNSAMSAVTGTLCAAKINCAKGTEDGGHSLGASNSEVSPLLAQFPLTSTKESKACDNKMVQEEMSVIKDSLQNSMSSGPGPREPSGLGPCLPLPPLPPPTPLDKLPELPLLRRQLPVFAEICSKPKADCAVEGHHLMGE